MSNHFRRVSRQEQGEAIPSSKEAPPQQAVGEGHGFPADQPSAREASPSERKGGGLVRVLLAEDHDIVRQSIADLISQDPDLELVGETGNGEEAIIMAHEIHPDVLVMDLSLPGISGIEATRQLTREAPETKIIAFSIHEEQDVAEALQDAGASAFVSKAKPPEHLIRTIRELGRRGA